MAKSRSGSVHPGLAPFRFCVCSLACCGSNQPCSQQLQAFADAARQVQSAHECAAWLQCDGAASLERGGALAGASAAPAPVCAVPVSRAKIWGLFNNSPKLSLYPALPTLSSLKWTRPFPNQASPAQFLSAAPATLPLLLDDQSQSLPARAVFTPPLCSTRNIAARCPARPRSLHHKAPDDG
jgi:hypothetical protein